MVPSLHSGGADSCFPLSFQDENWIQYCSKGKHCLLRQTLLVASASFVTEWHCSNMSKLPTSHSEYSRLNVKVKLKR